MGPWNEIEFTHLCLFPTPQYWKLWYGILPWTQVYDFSSVALHLYIIECIMISNILHIIGIFECNKCTHLYFFQKTQTWKLWYGILPWKNAHDLSPIIHIIMHHYMNWNDFKTFYIQLGSWNGIESTPLCIFITKQYWKLLYNILLRPQAPYITIHDVFYWNVFKVSISNLELGMEYNPHIFVYSQLHDNTGIYGAIYSCGHKHMIYLMKLLVLYIIMSFGMFSNIIHPVGTLE